MTDSAKISVDFASDIKDQLGDTPDLSLIVRDASIDATTAFSALPPTQPGVRSKAVVETVVLSATAAVTAAAAVKLLESAPAIPAVYISGDG